MTRSGHSWLTAPTTGGGLEITLDYSVTRGYSFSAARFKSLL
ncbi:hypothetical protein ASZ90_019962 [hydrocarbon metagenome]|uniref:Uncharacterized protein n=1 Tax=hydrocarbon metagenome TaxID=938273 RepID=A0A0W8E1U1_9ZZZZ